MGRKAGGGRTRGSKAAKKARKRRRTVVRTANMASKAPKGAKPLTRVRGASKARQRDVAKASRERSLMREQDRIAAAQERALGFNPYE